MSNPVFASASWNDVRAEERSDVMTVEGVVLKTGILLALLMCSLGTMWTYLWHGGHPIQAEVLPWMIGGGITALILGLIMYFAPKWAKVLSALYAIAEGVLLGGLVIFVEARYPGKYLSLLALAYTSATFVGFLMMYRMGWLKATPMFTKCVVGGIIGLVVGTLILSLLNMFGVGGGITSALQGGGPIGIIFSLVCIGLAAFSLILDFDMIEKGAQEGAPRYMEWVAAFGLLVTLVWLYIEILNLLQKLQRDD